MGLEGNMVLFKKFWDKKIGTSVQIAKFKYLFIIFPLNLSIVLFHTFYLS